LSPIDFDSFDATFHSSWQRVFEKQMISFFVDVRVVVELLSDNLRID
jgi:hypothetical protein